MPIGGLLGAMAGHAVESKFTPSGPDPQATKRIAFTVSVIALSAKMAKADGVVTHNEINAFRARVHIPPAEVKQVGRFWDLARKTPHGFEDYATQVARLFAPRAPVVYPAGFDEEPDVTLGRVNLCDRIELHSSCLLLLQTRALPIQCRC